MNTTYHDIIGLFVDKYGLTRGQVIAEIEKTFSSMLSRWHQKYVVCMFSDGQLVAHGYHEDATGTKQVPIELSTMRGWNSIKRIIDKNLGTAACLQEIASYKRKEQQMMWGEIVKQKSDSFSVELEIDQCKPILADCPLHYVGVHERDQLAVGQKRAFHIRRVEAVYLHDTPRTKITVDRVSKNLVTALLKSHLGQRYKGITIRCHNRYVGMKSFVATNDFLPKKVILAASHELGEHIQVKVDKEKSKVRR